MRMGFDADLKALLTGIFFNALKDVSEGRISDVEQLGAVFSMLNRVTQGACQQCGIDQLSEMEVLPALELSFAKKVIESFDSDAELKERVGHLLSGPVDWVFIRSAGYASDVHDEATGESKFTFAEDVFKTESEEKPKTWEEACVAASSKLERFNAKLDQEKANREASRRMAQELFQ